MKIRNKEQNFFNKINLPIFLIFISNIKSVDRTSLQFIYYYQGFNPRNEKNVFTNFGYIN